MEYYNDNIKHVNTENDDLLKDILQDKRNQLPQDTAKGIFQGICGCGHILSNKESVVQRILQEEAEIIPDDNETLSESLGRKYIRLNLYPAMMKGIKPEWIAQMMLYSPKPEESDRVRAAELILSLAKNAADSAAAEKYIDTAQKLMGDASFLPSHSQQYHQQYHPAYRVCGKCFQELLPVLARIGTAGKQRIVVAIDGRCGSGKTTIGERLAKITDAALLHTDDFFTPHAQKTHERLEMPGGNCDHERLVKEVIEPWVNGEKPLVRPYDCHEDKIMEGKPLPDSDILIVEGTYSLMTDIRKYVDVCVFIKIDKWTQRERIIARDGEEGYAEFQKKWIPLEETYFDAFSLPQKDFCIISREW